jgi:squalene synthase HpnC
VSDLDPIPLLPRFGPEGDAPTPSPAEARAYCHALTTSHYENFSVLSSLVPARLRDPFAAVYAFCRWSDDLGDETGSTPEARARSLELLAWWRAELAACFAHNADASAPAPRHPVYIALTQAIRAHALTIDPFADLISAFEMDQRVTRYQTWDELLDYCRLSANPVGRIVLRLGGITEARPDHAMLLAKSDATCTALQLINFWQDVRRDLVERDRVYLPERDTGITADTLRDWADRAGDPAARVPYIKAVRPLVVRTRALFAEGRDLPRHLPRDIAPVVRLFGDGGMAVVRAVERIGCATLWRRPSLPRATKGMLALRAMMAARVGGMLGPRTPTSTP